MSSNGRAPQPIPVSEIDDWSEPEVNISIDWNWGSAELAGKWNICEGLFKTPKMNYTCDKILK